jgi:antitoxin VapB
MVAPGSFVAEINRKNHHRSHFFFGQMFCPIPQQLAAVARQTYLAYAGAYVAGVAVTLQRHVKLFKNGRNQAVRIPREFELPGEDAILRKEGEKLIIEPTPPKSLLALLATLAPLEEEFPAIADLPPDPVGL